jgi:hypothetical protein
MMWILFHRLVGSIIIVMKLMGVTLPALSLNLAFRVRIFCGTLPAMTTAGTIQRLLSFHPCFQAKTGQGFPGLPTGGYGGLSLV